MTSRVSRRRSTRTSASKKIPIADKRKLSKPIDNSIDDDDSRDTVENEQEEKPTQTGKKFFKTKSLRDECVNINKTKKPSRNVKSKRSSLGVKFDLKDSPCAQTKVLRPRRNAKNYCEDSVLSKSQEISEKKRNLPKGPIYQCVETTESEKKGEQAYEFTFDAAAEHELLPIKKKRQTARKPVKKKPRKTVLKICVEKIDNPPRAEIIPENDSVEDNEPRLSIKSIENVTDKRIILREKEANKTITQVKNMMNHSLLSKSLSPIKRLADHFDPSSPWRPPPVHTFSQIRNLYQSTPQVGKIIPVVGKSINQIEIPRKFGTIITNVDHSLNSNPTVIMSDEKSLSSISMSSTVPLSQNKNSKSPLKSSFSTATTMLLSNKETNLSPTIEHVEIDKENTMPKEETPKRSPKKNRLVKALRLKSSVSRYDNPGPSNTKEGKPLRQTTLNSFLNLPDTPAIEVTSPRNELFSDNRSTILTREDIVESVPTVQNAFGFNDSDTELDISPIDTENLCNEFTSKPARLSYNEIKNNMIKNKNQVLVEKNDVKDFSDTFDMMENESMKEREEIPLFADLEPIHFATPPKHCYKRKRGIRFDYLEGEENDANEPVIKKLKGTRSKPKEDKRLKEWIKDVNRTFEEIDEFDLIVE